MSSLESNRFEEEREGLNEIEEASLPNNEETKVCCVPVLLCVLECAVILNVVFCNTISTVLYV